MFNEAQESNIILQGVLLTGIKDIKFDSSVNESSTKLLSNQGIRRKIYGPQKTTCSFSKPYNGKDFIQSLTGVADLSGQFIYKDNAIDFSDAVISNYSLNLNEDGFAEVSVKLQIFGDTKPTTNLQLTNAVQDFPILNRTPNILYFDLDGKSSAIKNFKYDASLNPKSSNIIGSTNSSNIDFTSPAVHNISADIEISGQEVEDVTGFLDNSKLTKNIDIVFGAEEDRSKINNILYIQNQVKIIESSGFKVNDLDFSMGTCAYNAFQFSKASISNQDLNVKAGDGVQITNKYSAYSNTRKITGSIPLPGENLSSSQHYKKILNNFNILLARSNTFTFTNELDFENKFRGQVLSDELINLNLFKNLIDFENQSIGDTGIISFKQIIDLIDFEDQSLGETGMIDLSLYKNLIDFEDQSIGETGLIDLSSFENSISIDFENQQVGSTGLLKILQDENDFEIATVGVHERYVVDPLNIQKEDFENESIGGTGLIEFGQIEFGMQSNFESESIGETGMIEFGQIPLKEGFENESIGETGLIDLDPLRSLIDFFNEGDFESESLGQIETNLIKLDLSEVESFETFAVGSTGLNELVIDNFFNKTDFESEPLGEAGLNEIVLNDFFNKTDFESETEGLVALNELVINDFFDQVDFESEIIGTTTLNQIFDDSIYTNETSFELESLGEISTNLVYLKIIV